MEHAADADERLSERGPLHARALVHRVDRGPQQLDLLAATDGPAEDEGAFIPHERVDLVDAAADRKGFGSGSRKAGPGPPDNRPVGRSPVPLGSLAIGLARTADG